jgi:hypothetical protein
MILGNSMIGSVGGVATAAAIVMAASNFVAVGANAGVAVAGRLDAIELTVKDETVRDVLDRLASVYDLELHDTEGLDEHISGTFRGGLQRVLDGVLRAQSFIVSNKGAKLAVFVIGNTASRPDPAETQPTVIATTPVAPRALQPAVRPPAVQPEMSPQGRRLAEKLFGPDVLPLQVDESQLRNFAAGRGGRRVLRVAP